MINRRNLDKIFVPQHDMTDCGVACLLMLIKYYGGDSSIVHLRELSGTSNFGTTLLGLCQASQNMGFSSRGVEADSIEELKRLDKPCILNVCIDEKIEHFTVFFEYSNDKFLIGDPGRDIIEMTEEELSSIWTKKCLLLEPTSAFELKEKGLRKKKEWILSLIREDYGILFSTLIIGIITTILGLSMTMFSQVLVDSILPNKDMLKLSIGLGSVFILTLFSTYITTIREKLLLKQCYDFNNRITFFFFRKLLNLPKSFFDVRKVGDILSRLGDTNRIQSVISSMINGTIISILVLVFNIVLLFYYSQRIAFFTLLCSPFFFWLIARNNKKIMIQQKDAMSSAADSESSFINTINGIVTIKSFSKQESFLNINSSLFSTFQEKLVNLGKTKIKIGLEVGIISTIVNIVLIAFCSVWVIRDTMTAGVLIAVIGISSTIFSTVSGLASIIIPINEAKVAFQRMYEFVDIVEEHNDEAKNLITKNYDANQIELKDLSFRYTGRKLLLNRVSLTFNKGTITSIVGESGCGKSTMCQLLERFYSPSSGDILIDGMNIKNLPYSQWYDMVSYVPQEIYLYNGTIADNICIGDEEKNYEEIAGFCDKYGFGEYFSDLPYNIFTLVGEEGINLSGGQKQLVAFARALYKPSKVLILDEMTASMDRKTERFICKLLMELKKDHIIVFVTHRLETARLLSDQIVVMEKGSVSAVGSHNGLMNTDNFYSQYWNAIYDNSYSFN